MLHILYSLIGLVKTLLEVFPDANTAMDAAEQMAADYIKANHGADASDVLHQLPSKAGFYRRRVAGGCEAVRVDELVDKGWVRNGLRYRETTLATFAVDEFNASGVVLASDHDFQIAGLNAEIARQRGDVEFMASNVLKISDNNKSIHHQLQIACDQNAQLLRSQKTIEDAVATLRDENGVLRDENGILRDDNKCLVMQVAQQRLDYDETTGNISRCMMEITDLKSQLDAMTRKYNMTQTQYEAERFLNGKLEDEIATVHQENVSLTQQVDNLITGNTQLYEDLRRMEHSLSRANDDTARDCAMIGEYAIQLKTIADEAVELRHLIDKSERMIESLATECNLLRDAGANTLAENESLRTQNQAMADECNVLTEQNVALSKAKDDLTHRCDVLDEVHCNDNLEMAEAHERLSVANEQIEELVEERSAHLAEIAELNEQHSAMLAEIAELKTENRRRASQLLNSTRLEETRVPIRGVAHAPASHAPAGPRVMKRPGWSQVVDELKCRLARRVPESSRKSFISYDENAIDDLLKELNTNLECM